MSAHPHQEDDDRIPPDTSITPSEVNEIIDLVRDFCPDQAVSSGTATAWTVAFAYSGVTYDEAVTSVQLFALSETFNLRKFRYIDHSDILSMRKTIRRARTRRLVLPPPPNPDNPTSAIAHQRAVYGSVASGASPRLGKESLRRQEAFERRAGAIRAVEAGQDSDAAEGSGAPGESSRALLEEARRRCSEANISSRNRERDRTDTPPAPRRPTRAAATHTDPLSGTSSLAATLGTSRFGASVRARTRSQTSEDPFPNEGTWCGTCHRETGTKILPRPDGSQERIPCCTPERAGVA